MGQVKKINEDHLTELKDQHEQEKLQLIQEILFGNKERTRDKQMDELHLKVEELYKDQLEKLKIFNQSLCERLEEISKKGQDKHSELVSDINQLKSTIQGQLTDFQDSIKKDYISKETLKDGLSYIQNSLK